MIVFSWTLTPNQIAILKALRDDPDGNSAFMFSHFVSGSKAILREKYCTRTDVPVTAAERENWTGKMRPKWEITEKGRLALRMVELELADQQNDLKQITTRKKTKQLTSNRA